MPVSNHRPRVFLDVNIGELPAGRLVVELFVDKAPKTCENFRQLCTGEHQNLSYASVPFHRVIDEFMIQGGDIANGDGTGTASIYDGEFDDEELHWREMDAAGLVCAANRGPDTNGSQFFITLEPCPHLNGKHTIFGRLVSGDETIHKIAKVAVDKNDVPVEPVLVSRCGELERREKQDKQDTTASRRDPTALAERGRRRKSDNSDEEMEDGPDPVVHRRARRQSDNIVDEGIRGRPRLRSGSRSRSPAIEEDEDDDQPSDQPSPARTYKRKRNPSPSRHGDSRERRRRSLPNQYVDRHDRDHSEYDRYRPSPRRDSHRDSGGRRFENRYRPSKHHYQDVGRLNGDGRLGGGSGGGGGGGYDDHSPSVNYKGRGVMKYRAPERRW